MGVERGAVACLGTVVDDILEHFLLHLRWRTEPLGVLNVELHEHARGGLGPEHAFQEFIEMLGDGFELEELRGGVTFRETRGRRGLRQGASVDG